MLQHRTSSFAAHFLPRSPGCSCSYCVSCYHSSVEVSQPGDQMLCPMALLLVLVSLVSQGFVFGAGGVSVALVLRDMLMSRKDLTSTCTWGDPLVVPSWEHPGGSLPPASGDMCPSVPSPPPGPRAALQCLIRGHGAGWWSRSGWPAPAWTFYGG